MQLKLTFEFNKPLALPLGHHSTLQGFIYNQLSSYPDYSDFLHNSGYSDGPHAFKLFVFSTLKGKHSISGGKIIFYDKIYLEVRSPDPAFCNVLSNALSFSDTAILNRQEIHLSEFTFTKKTVSSDSVDIKMLSPLTLSTTYYEGERKKTRFLTPIDPDFNDALNRNATSKYRAAYHEDLGSEILLNTLDFNDKNKYVTKFNGIYINAWNGSFHLSGDPDVLSFLYDSGLGSRNSQGFGMFEVI